MSGALATDGRRRRGDRTRTAILDRAVRIASTEGLQSLTLGQVAAESGVAKTSVSALFKGKLGLQLRTLDAAVELFVSEVVRPHESLVSPRARLAAWCDAWFNYVEGRILPGGCLVTAAASEYRARPGVIQRAVRSHREAWRRLLLAAAEQAAAAGELTNVDAGQLVFEILAFQAVANCASLLGDADDFARARSACEARLAA